MLAALGLRLRLTPVAALGDPPWPAATGTVACGAFHWMDTLRRASVMLATKLGNFIRASDRKALIRSPIGGAIG